MAFTFAADHVRCLEQSLVEQHSLLDALLDSLDVAVVACSADGKLTHANRKTAELVGGRCFAGVLPEDWLEQAHFSTPEGRPLSLNELPLLQALEGSQADGIDLRLRVQQRELLVHTRANPIHDRQGRQVGAVAVFEDVTDRRAHESKIREELGYAAVALEVKEAIASDRLLLHAQPIVDLSSGDIVLEELLLRVRSPEGLVAGPCELLAAAERSGTVANIDAWVVEQAADLAAHGRPVSVNVSARTISTRSFLEVVERALLRHGPAPGLITFEVTETAIVSDIVQATRFAERLAELGCKFALDDFGTGYAALTYLKHLPFQYIKIDIEFVRDLLNNPRSRGVVSAIVNIASSFGQQTIAEGVEDATTVCLLRELGVDLAQGFHLGRPAPLAAPTPRGKLTKARAA